MHHYRLAGGPLGNAACDGGGGGRCTSLHRFERRVIGEAIRAGSGCRSSSARGAAARDFIEMSHALQLLIDLDRDAVRATGELRWAPATVVLAFVSAWWIKGPLLVAAAFCADLRNRRLLPLAALAATASFALASGLNAVVKDLVDRSRPPAAMGWDALVGVPGSPSFPSGHAMSAFATATAVAVLAPRLRAPVLALATVIAFSRVYLGVHFWLDILVGAALGAAIGVAVATALRRAAGGQTGAVPRAGAAVTS
jgi:membrane-associated phospholipid phosphatase